MSTSSVTRIFAAVSLTVAGCAGPGGIGIGGKADGTMVTGAPCGAVYTAAIEAVPDAGFRVTSLDRASGVIIGSQDVVMGGGSAVGLTVSTSTRGRECVLTAVVMAPPAGFSLVPLSGDVDSYLAAVQTRMGAGHRMAGVR